KTATTSAGPIGSETIQSSTAESSNQLRPTHAPVPSTATTANIAKRRRRRLETCKQWSAQAGPIEVGDVREPVYRALWRYRNTRRVCYRTSGETIVCTRPTSSEYNQRKCRGKSKEMLQLIEISALRSMKYSPFWTTIILRSAD